MSRPSRPHLATLVDDFELRRNGIAFVTPRGLRRFRTRYGELAVLCRRFAAALEDRGIGKGERVLLWGENSAEWVAAFFGCVLRGVLPVPVDASSPPSFLRRIAAETSPKLLLTGATLLAESELNLPTVAFQNLASILPPRLAASEPSLGLDDPLQIVFTSGTTREPKGVVHTHRNVLASLGPIEAEMEKYLRYERPFHPVRFLHTLPLSHVFGQFMGLWIPPLLAAEVHFETRLVPGELMERMQRERISVLASVPRVLELLHAHLLRQQPALAARASTAVAIPAWQRWWRFRDVHRQFGWKFWAFICGGASLPPALEQFWGRLGFLVVQGYGMTETTALVSLNHPFRAAGGTVGQVLPGRQVQLTGDGEVLVRGETISNATWQNGAVHTAETDWLATGDLAEFDEAGNLRFRGRKKDVIVTAAGLNIYPEDLESALLRQRSIRSVAVVESNASGRPEPQAVLVLQPHATPAMAEAAVVAANAELADFQQIRDWTLWPEPDLPRTSTGKVLKREIVARLAAESISSHQEWSTASTNVPGLSADALLDSLGRVELQARLEQQYGIALDDAALQSVRTPADVRQLIVASAGPSAAASPAAAKRESTFDMQDPERHLYPRWPWSRPIQFVRTLFLEAVALPLVRFLTRAKTHSRVARWPREPMLIVANHVTSYDVPFILYALPGPVRRRTAVAMSGEMVLDFRRGRNQGHWLLNLVAPVAYLLFTALFNVFPLPQRSGYRRSFRHAGEAMDHGFSVIVFPEGRRSDDGAAQPFRTGAGLLWKELGAPAVAVRLQGLGEAKAGSRSWFRSGTIQAQVTALLPAPPPERSPEQLTALLAGAVFSESI